MKNLPPGLNSETFSINVNFIFKFHRPSHKPSISILTSSFRFQPPTSLHKPSVSIYASPPDSHPLPCFTGLQSRSRFHVQICPLLVLILTSSFNSAPPSLLYRLSISIPTSDFNSTSLTFQGFQSPSNSTPRYLASPTFISNLDFIFAPSTFLQRSFFLSNASW